MKELGEPQAERKAKIPEGTHSLSKQKQPALCPRAFAAEQSAQVPRCRCYVLELSSNIASLHFIIFSQEMKSRTSCFVRET